MIKMYQTRIDNLNSSGLSYQIKNSFYADVEETVSDQTTSKISKLKYRLDLRTGMKVEEIAYDLQTDPFITEFQAMRILKEHQCFNENSSMNTE